MKFRSSFGLIVALFSMQTIAANKPLVFATPPTQSPEITLKNYQPLIDYISGVIGQEIVIQPAKSFSEYSKNMRQGQYDLVFDGPHFVNWRIKTQQHKVIAKQPGELHFAIVVRKDSRITKLRDLWAKRVFAPPAPHLGTLTLIDLYNNPIREPEIVTVKSFKEGLECLRSGKGEAALVRDKYWSKKADKTGLQVMHVTARKMPARGLSVNNRVSKAAQRKMTQALTSREAQAFTEKAFASIGGGKFIKASTQEYSNLDDLIQIVFGFRM